MHGKLRFALSAQGPYRTQMLFLGGKLEGRFDPSDSGADIVSLAELFGNVVRVIRGDLGYVYRGVCLASDPSLGTVLAEDIRCGHSLPDLRYLPVHDIAGFEDVRGVGRDDHRHTFLVIEDQSPDL